MLNPTTRFWSAIADHFFGEEHWELEYPDFLKIGEEYGLLSKVPYDPAVHGQIDAVEPGEMIHWLNDEGMRLVEEGRHA